MWEWTVRGFGAARVGGGRQSQWTRERAALKPTGSRFQARCIAFGYVRVWTIGDAMFLSPRSAVQRRRPDRLQHLQCGWATHVLRRAPP